MAAKRKRPRNKERIQVRYFFYAFAIALILVTGYYVNGYTNGTVSIDTLNADTSITLSLMFSVFVIAYLLLKGWDLKSIIRSLGLSRDKLNVAALITGVKLLAIVFAFEIFITLFSAVTGIQLPTNVGTTLAGLPLYFLAFSFLIAPINEEILFRGFMVPRLGIVFSALIFALMHWDYMSISEFFAAFLFGLAAGYYFKKTGSLYSTIFAHVIVNLMAVSALLLFGAAAVS